jgi:hypothetical protein
MPGSVCKRDALLKWCGEKLANYVSWHFSRRKLWRLENYIGYSNNKFFKFMDRWYCILFVITLLFTWSDWSGSN